MISSRPRSRIECVSRMDARRSLAKIKLRTGQGLSIALSIVFATLGWRHGMHTPPARDMWRFAVEILPALMFVAFCTAVALRVAAVAQIRGAAVAARRALRRLYAMTPARCPTPQETARHGHMALVSTATVLGTAYARAVTDAAISHLHIIAATLCARLVAIPHSAVPSRG